MSSAEEIEKLKVADLRKELKARGLSMAGNKPELVQRLNEFIGSKGDGKTAMTATPEDDEALEDAVLGISAADSTVSGFPLDSATLEDKILDDIPPTPTQPKLPATISSPKQAGVPTAPAAQKPSTVPTVPAVQSTLADTGDAAKTEEEGGGARKKITFGTTGGGPVLSAAERAKKFNLSVTELTPEQRKNLRQERFGVGATTTAVTTGTAANNSLKQRAERFNLTKPAAGTEPAKALDEAQQKRLERFGNLTDANGEAKKETDASASRLKLVTPSDEALKKRAQRFGIQNESASKIDTIKKISEEDRKNKRKQKFDLSSSVVSKDADPEVKRQKRAERFTLRQ